MKIVKIAQCVLSFLICTFSVGDVLAEGIEPKKLAEQFLEGLAKGDIRIAYSKLFQESEIIKVRGEEITKLRQQTEMALPVFGNMAGYDKICETAFGKALVRLVYITRMERHPVIWEFFFYKPKAEWMVASVNFNDQFLRLNCDR
jgi:hypothetical protein